VAEVEIRAERPDEEPGRTLLAAFEREIASRYPGWDATQKPTARPEEIGPPVGRFLVAYVDGEPAGCGALKRLDERAAEIKRVYVAPAARGGGIARRLLVALEDAAKELGYVRVRLDTGARQPDAVALFRCSGYEEIEAYNENAFAAHWFEKRLRPKS
jgi:GNAT superfamily N-acetyltransferase